MRETRLDLRALAAPDTVWISREHDRLDAGLAATFLETVWGSVASARREFGAYRHALVAHLKESERRLFSAIASLDERTRALERLEWRAHTRDLRQACTSILRELGTPSYGRSIAFAGLRCALRRHRRHQQHLLKLAASAAEARAA